MFRQIVCLGLFLCLSSQITHSSPFFGHFSNDPNSSDSLLGTILKYKAQFIQGIVNNIRQTFQRGFDAFANNFNNFGNTIPKVIGATNQIIDDGLAAGRQYGSAIFQGVMIVPKSIADLLAALSQNNAYIDENAARSLSYVNGRPNYLFQYVDKDGRIIPVTAQVALQLVPTLNV